jgi:predicted permease
VSVRGTFDRWFRPDEHARREIDDEIAAHLEARVEHLVRHGMAEDDARREALRRFGDVEAARAALLARARSRRRRLELSERVGRLQMDIRFVIRSLTRNPTFSIGVITTLALGLGINAAVFRVADYVLFRPPAGVSGARHVHRVEASITIDGIPPQRARAFSYPDARRILESGAFEQTAIYTRPAVHRDSEARGIGVSYVSDTYFPMLGVSMARGRSFDATEGRPGSSEGVAIASFAYWQRALAANPLDSQSFLTIGSRQYRLVGVAQAGFSGIDLDPVDVWIPLGDAELGRGSVNGVPIAWYQSDMLRALTIIGRIQPGREEEARHKLTAALTIADSTFAPPKRDAHLEPIVPVGDTPRGASAAQLLIRLTAVASVIMVIACGNAMNLLLARSLRRAREIGIRFAVGASRLRVARLLIVESVVLALAGAVAATLSAFWTADALRRLVFPDSRWAADAFDARTALFTSALGLAAGIVAGAVPALQTTRHGLASVLKEGRIPAGRASRTRSALIVVQTALCLALLVGCGLLVQSLFRLHAVDLGFDPRGLVVLSGGRLGPPEADLEEIADRLRSSAQVQSVALASIAPFGAMAMVDITVPGATFVPESNRDHPLYAAVDDHYFAAMGMRVVSGRGLGPGDIAGAEQVAVVNESMARRFWGPASPFESCIIAPPNPCARVIGIVSDVIDAPGATPPMRFYLSLPQSLAKLPAAMIVRTAPEHVTGVVATARTMFGASRPPIIDVVVDRIGRAMHPWRTATFLFSALGVLALALACVGIYSVTSYLVSERMHEMGIRLALGATGATVIGLVVSRGLRLLCLGTVVGLMAAAGLGHLLGALLFEVSVVEPVIYAGTAGCLTVLATLAMLPAALRASRADPVDTLRAE